MAKPTLRARIVLTDGTVVEKATGLALRPAVLHFRDAKGKERHVEVNGVQQVSFEQEQILVEVDGGLRAIPGAEYEPKKHGKAVERRTVLVGPVEGDIAKLPPHPKR